MYCALGLIWDSRIVGFGTHLYSIEVYASVTADTWCGGAVVVWQRTLSQFVLFAAVLFAAVQGLRVTQYRLVHVIKAGLNADVKAAARDCQ